MENYIFIIVLMTVIFVVLFLLIVRFFQSRDMKIDYSNKKIRCFVRDINGIDYLIVPYCFWQKGKLSEIKKRFSKSVVLDDEHYNVDITYPNQEHEKTPSDLFPSWVYRDFRAKISKPQFANNYGNINNTFVSGNENLIEIHQENNNKISSEIERIISNESFDDADKIFLELFKYKLNDKSAKKEDANKAIDILTKALPFTTAVINLIKSIFFT